MDKETRERTLRETADKCFDRIRSAGRHSCGGCHLDYYCQMPGYGTKRMTELFGDVLADIPKIELKPIVKDGK